MDTLTPLPPAQLERFRNELEQVANDVCSAHGLDPRDCVAEAIVTSGCGRFSLAFNWWNLPGSGSRGCYYAVIAPISDSIKNGGVDPQIEQRAKYGSPQEAVAAWCAARGK